MIMYKILIFTLTTDKDFCNYFNSNFIPLLNEINGNEVKIGKVESNLLLDLKYDQFCEISADSKDQMDEKLNSPAGRKLGKLLMESHQNLSVIAVNFE